MSIDFPRAWELAQATPVEKHDKKCSYRQTDGCLICDCHVITKHPEYLDDVLQGAGGVPCEEDQKRKGPGQA